MDNDSTIKKKIVQTYRAVRQKLDYFGMNYVTEQAGHQKIASLLEANIPFMVGRLGAVEMRCVSKWMKGVACSNSEKDQALYAAGIFPNTDSTISHFCKI